MLQLQVDTAAAMADSIGGALEACNSQGMLLPSTNLRCVFVGKQVARQTRRMRAHVTCGVDGSDRMRPLP